MKDHSYDLTQSNSSLRSGSLVSLKDYFVGDDHSPNPYASIDDFLDETWSLDAASSDKDSRGTNHFLLS